MYMCVYMMCMYIYIHLFKAINVPLSIVLTTCHNFGYAVQALSTVKYF